MYQCEWDLDTQFPLLSYNEEFLEEDHILKFLQQICTVNFWFDSEYDLVCIGWRETVGVDCAMMEAEFSTS